MEAIPKFEKQENVREALKLLTWERNILKHVVILKEHLAPQYGYYGFALLRNISRNYVFGAWVRENYF
ncbi:hypothetical protein CICLE_v10003069mg [Citrus x clementina]|uniref:Uncharacterized protein n=1 Tax=Citrus clementina TaxID=85681 RepID=V4UZ55_CITCL|nr:hypothetical protein CICLE_v10003069mg [Citrus x clementina]